jgi:hypothetical protein
MKYTLHILALTSSLLLAGCSDSSKPLDSGTAISGVIWEHPVSTTASNSGGPIPPDAIVDIYDRLIIIHLKDGTRQIVPLDFVTDLKLK